MEKERFAALLVAIVLLAVALLGSILSGIGYFTNGSTPTFVQNGGGGTVITTTANGYNVSNITAIDPFVITLNGSYFKMYANHINFGSAIIAVNGSYYGLYPNSPELIRRIPGYAFYAEVDRISYNTTPHTVSILFYSVALPQPQLLNLSYNLAANTPIEVNIPNTSATVVLSSQTATAVNFAVTNVTNSIKTPQNYNRLIILNISTSQPSVGVQLLFKYKCSLPYQSIVPFELQNNNTWSAIAQFSVNASACTVSFGVPFDRVVGVFQNAQYTPSTVSIYETTAPTTIVSTTIIQKAANHSGGWFSLAVVLVLVLILIVYYLSKGSKKRKGPKSKMPQSR